MNFPECEQFAGNPARYAWCTNAKGNLDKTNTFRRGHGLPPIFTKHVEVKESCSSNVDGVCQVSTYLVNTPVPVNNDVCAACSATRNPRDVNEVTCSRAAWAAVKAGIALPSNVRNCSQASHIEHGPGTELKKLISWFVWSDKIRKCSVCATREQRMNRWGPDKCEKNILTIIEWLRESAMKNGYPFSARVAAAMVRKAIANSRKS